MCKFALLLILSLASLSAMGCAFEETQRSRSSWIESTGGQYDGTDGSNFGSNGWHS